MLSFTVWRDLRWLRFANFTRPDQDHIYQWCVLEALSHPRTERLLASHDLSKAAVEQDMLRPHISLLAVSRCRGRAYSEYRYAYEVLEDLEEERRTLADESRWDWRVVVSLLAGAMFTVLLLGGLLWLGGAVVAVAVLWFVLARRRSPVSERGSEALLGAGLAFSWAVCRVDVGIKALRWGKVLLAEGTLPAVPDAVRRLIGDEPDSLFLPDRFSGLRTPRSPEHVVDNRATSQLQRKLAQVEYGTIAVCGPRGSGKTTLLEHCVKDADLGLLAQAPATYAPHDFLLSLSVRLCEAYVREAGYDVPEFTRLSPARRMLGRLRAGARRLGRWSVFALPAAALVVLGLSASARSLYSLYADSLGDAARERGDALRERVVDIWEGHAVVASLLVTAGGVVWWRSRHAAWLPRLVRAGWRQACHLLGFLLMLVSLASLVVDEQLAERTSPVRPGTVVAGGLLFLAWRVCVGVRDSGGGFSLGRRRIDLGRVFQPVAAVAACSLLLYLVDSPEIYPLLADEDNPLRMTGFVVGLVLVKAGGWQPRPAEPELVTRCRNHLYRLQTIQTSSNTLNATGAAQVLSLGGSHATSVSTIPPNFPELVDALRDLLTRIGAAYAQRNKTVVIAIDEVDRLGSDTEALAFLSEIKAVLGVPHVYYLISVAEDVGATFVRRGLPHRGVTDSSLDDIVHVQPSTFQESQKILAKRTDRLTDPYVMLAHALSGGILRDLLRYGIQISEMQEKSQSYELTDISRHLVLEELSETLAGFRTLLSRHQWTRDTSAVLSAFGTLDTYLSAPAPCPCDHARLHSHLEEFAFHPASERFSPAVAGQLAPEALQLVDEAAAYAHFSLTLLDIFTVKRLTERAALAARHGPDGEPGRLAQARQELGISAHSARPLIDDIRTAWSLPLQPDPTPIRSSRRDCPTHGSATPGH
ncbi:orc1/cdc6 family replication initiation protein [Streptomyces silaceus]|uniref:orc1/cdc6 family replication initiation protein n=1 Tax=Streptomyces silaceus TaxID=545123 RepID=UPI0006EBC92E|nr:orc1/cdc6 family replication initiation protein [Streptomyces silaceus]